MTKPLTRLSISIVIAAAALVVLALGMTAPAAAGTETSAPGAEIVVTTTDDDLAANRNCTLREAVQAANTNAAVDACPAGTSRPDTIIVPAGTYTLTLAGSGEDSNQTGDLDILEAVTISGDKAGATIVNGNGLDRVLHLDHVDVVISWLAIIGGHSPDGADHASGANGGGIYQDGGTLTLSYCQVISNSTGDGGTGVPGGAGGSGGGIYTYPGILTMDQVTVSNNTAGNGGPGALGGSGAGIYIQNGQLTLVNSTVADNTAGNGGGGSSGGGGGGISNVSGSVVMTGTTVSGNAAGNSGGGPMAYPGTGGGIYNSAGRVTVFRSTISGNQAGVPSGWGGGVMSNGTLTMTNSTLSGNTSQGYGGGLYHSGSSYTATLEAVTVSYNTAGQTGQTFSGGGVWVAAGSPLEIRNSILAGNTNIWLFGGSGRPDCNGELISYGYNLIGDTTGCNILGDMTGLKLNVYAQLYGLTDNGGRTRTIALAPSSPAVDAASCVDIHGAPMTADQREYPRPRGLSCDMGAYESEHLALWVNKEVEDSTVPQGTLFSYTVLATNGSIAQLTGAVISDTLPPSLTLAGPVVMTPHQSGAILATEASDLPTVASQVAISAGLQISFVIPVSVSWAITPGTLLHNTVWLTASQVLTPQTDGRTISVVEGVQPEITATDPADGDWLVPLTAPVVITFSEPIAIFELEVLVDPDPGGWAESWNGPWTAVTLTHHAFQPGTTYAVTVTEAPDFKANPLAGAPVSWHFSTPLHIYLPLILRGSG